MPDIATRQLLNLIYKKYSSRIKYFCLTDANPYGIQIMSTYKYGSKVRKQRQIFDLNSVLTYSVLKIFT